MRLVLVINGFLVAAGLTVGVGCQAPPQPTGPTVERVSASSPEEREQLFEAACDTLRRHSFRLDRQDKVNGVIASYPETTAQWFEFARPQPRPAYYWWEANTHTIQRQVTVQLQGGSPGEEAAVDVKVERLRYRLEERQIDNAAGAMRIFSADAPTTAGRREKPSKTGSWVPLGRDEQMEQTLLNALLANYHKRVGSPVPEPSAATQPAAGR